MNNQQAVRVTTLLVIGVAFVFVARRQVDWRWERTAAEVVGLIPERTPAPADAINYMMNAARDGDVSAYLASYGGQMEKVLRQNMSEMGADQFSKYLREKDRQIKGLAIHEPKMMGTDEAEIRVEYVYADRNEAQRFYLRRAIDRWTITRVDTVETWQTAVPYGTPSN